MGNCGRRLQLPLLADLFVKRGDRISDIVIVAIVTGIFSVIGQWLISRSANEKRQSDNEIRDARLDDRLAGVEKRLDTHNRYAERFNEIQMDIAVIKNDIKTLYKAKE